MRLRLRYWLPIINIKFKADFRNKIPEICFLMSAMIYSFEENVQILAPNMYNFGSLVEKKCE